MTRKYIVVSCEHSNSMDEFPQLLGSFPTKKEAEKFIARKIATSNRWYGTERVEKGVDLVQRYAESGDPDYGCAFSIIEI